MAFQPERHHRRSIRLPGHDYQAVGHYFVTICSFEKQCLFGTMIDDVVDLTPYGHLVEVCWWSIPDHFPSVKLHQFVIMPNHLHGIVEITIKQPPDVHVPIAEQFGSPVSSSLPTMIRSFKAAATKSINELLSTSGTTVWQRGYHERIVRTPQELENVRRYIENNPKTWSEDPEFPESRDRLVRIHRP